MAATPTGDGETQTVGKDHCFIHHCPDVLHITTCTKLPAAVAPAVIVLVLLSSGLRF